MQKHDKIFISLLMCILSFVQVGCGHEDNRSLAEAEHLMTAYPDSALSILESMDISDIHSNSDRALYGLLMTQALDKNHLNPTDESLITPAVEYYRHDADILRSIKSNYYQGRVYLNKNNNPMALVSFFKAKNMAESYGDVFWAAMACRGISDIYNTSYNSAEELTYARMEYDHMKKSGIQPYLNYALLDLGRALFNHNQYEESLAAANQLADSAKIHDDAYLDYLALQLKVRILTFQENIKEGLPAASTLCANEYAESGDTLSLALLNAYAGDPEGAIDLLHSLSETDPETELHVRYINAYKAGNHKEALEHSLQINNLTESNFKKAMNQNLSGTLADYFELTNRADNAKIKTYQARIWILALSAAMILGVVILIITVGHNRQKRRMADKILLAEQLRESLTRSNFLLDESRSKLNETETSLNEKIILLNESKSTLHEKDNILNEKISLLEEKDNMLKEKDNMLEEKDYMLEGKDNLLEEKDYLLEEKDNMLAQSNAMMEDSLSKIKILLTSKYGMLNKLSMVVYSTGGSKNAERRIADTVSQIIKDFTVSKDGLKKLEDELNSNCNNLMQDFRHDLPGLKDIDYLLFLLSALRFSIPVISLFLKEERIQSIYNRKRRLKDRIGKLSTAQKERYIAYLL